MSSVASLLLSHAHVPDLGVGEDSCWYVFVRECAQVVWVQHIVLDDASFRVGHVLELEGGGDIAERPHSGSGGASILIDLDALAVHLNATLVQVHQVAVGGASGRRNQDIGGQFLAIVQGDGHAAVGVFLRSSHFIAEACVPSFGCQFREAVRNLLIQVLEKAWAAVHHSHVDTQRREYVRELYRDEAAAKNDHGLGQLR